MKLEYGSHYEPANVTAHQQDEEIVRMEHEEMRLSPELTQTVKTLFAVR